MLPVLVLGVESPPGIIADARPSPTWGLRAAPFLMGQNGSAESKIIDDEIGAQYGPQRYGILLDAWRALAGDGDLIFAGGGFLGGYLHSWGSAAAPDRSLHDETFYAGASGRLILRLGEAANLVVAPRLGVAGGRLSWGGPAPWKLGGLLGGELGFSFPRACVDFGLGWIFAPIPGSGGVAATYDRGGVYVFVGFHFGL